MGLKRALEGLLSRLKRAPSPGAPTADAAPRKTDSPAPLSGALEYCERGTRRLHSGEIDAAIADFSSAIGLDAGCSKAYAGRGVALERAGKTDEAKKDYAKSIEIELRVALKAEYGYDVPKA